MNQLLEHIDFRKDHRKWFLCSVNLCREKGKEQLFIHNTINEAQNSLKQMEINCDSTCRGRHFMVEIARGHMQNMKRKSIYGTSYYLRWLIRKNYVREPDMYKYKKQEEQLTARRTPVRKAACFFNNV